MYGLYVYVQWLSLGKLEKFGFLLQYISVTVNC